jgi:hypothetical protein
MWLVNVRIATAVVDGIVAVAAVVLPCEEVVVEIVVITEIVAMMTVEEMTGLIATVETAVLLRTVAVPLAVAPAALHRHHAMGEGVIVTVVRLAVAMMTTAMTSILGVVVVDHVVTGVWIIVGPVDLVLRTIDTVIAAVLMRLRLTVAETGTEGTLDLK